MQCDCNLDKAEHAIVFIDEIDKKGSQNKEDVSGKALDITFNITEIASFVNPTCNNL